MTRAGLASARWATSEIRVSEKPRSQITSTAARSICSRRWSGPLATSGAASLTGTLRHLSLRYRPLHKLLVTLLVPGPVNSID